VDKSRLEKGVGLTKKLSELRFLVFGQCENGYRIIVNGGSGGTNAKGAAIIKEKAVPASSNKRGGPLTADQKAQIERLKRIGGSTEEKHAPKQSDTALENSTNNRRQRREMARQQKNSSAPEEGRNSRSRSRERTKEEAEQDWQRKAAKAKQMAEDAKRARRGQEIQSASKRPEVRSKDKSKSSWRSAPDEYLSKKAPADPSKAVEIEWPEDWR